MADQMIEMLRDKHEIHRVSQMSFDLSAAYRTTVELLAFHDEMDGYIEVSCSGGIPKASANFLRVLGWAFDFRFSKR